MTTTPLLLRVVWLYVVTGVCLWSVFTLQSYLQPEVVVATRVIVPVKPDLHVKKIISGIPSRITIERLNIDLEVRDGAYNYDTDEWTLSNDATHYAQMTSKANDYRGSTFIYGHNTDAVLARMSGLIVGDIVTIKTANGHTFHYVYRSDDLVPPSVTEVLNDNPPTPRLTVMTCEGIWSQQRRLMYFDFKDVL